MYFMGCDERKRENREVTERNFIKPYQVRAHLVKCAAEERSAAAQTAVECEG